VVQFETILYSLHKITVSVLSIFLFSSASGNDPFFTSAGAAEAGMSYSCVTGPGFWSSFHNQAWLPFNTSASFGINYQNRFNISELGTRSAALVIPSGKASLGAIYSNFGYKDFMRHTAGLACGLKLSENISGGVQADFFYEKSVGKYHERRSLSFEAGLLIIPSEKIRIGFHIFNPVPNSWRNNYLPSSIRAGAGIWLSNALFASAEAEMSSGKNLNLKTGFEYEPAKNIKVRGGFSSENTSFSFGIGYLLKFAQLDLGFSTHDRLGVTSAASIIFKLK
jgi:hypothetical protein